MPKDEPQNVTLHAAWIAKLVKSKLSHYPSDWRVDQATIDGVIDDWVDFLSPFSRMAIEGAFSAHMRDEPGVRPTPGMIRARAKALTENASGVRFGNRDQLSTDERWTLEQKVLPTARKWLSIPGLAEHGKQTLEYWGEKV